MHLAQGGGVTALITATLQRQESTTSWGFRLAGGYDFQKPVTIERVVYASLADRCGLRPGDVVVTISGTLTSNMRHQDAHDTVLRAGNILILELQRYSTDNQQFGSSSRYGYGYEDARPAVMQVSSPMMQVPSPMSTYTTPSYPAAYDKPVPLKEGHDAVIAELSSNIVDAKSMSPKSLTTYSLPGPRPPLQSRTFLELQSKLDRGEEGKVERRMSYGTMVQIHKQRQKLVKEREMKDQCDYKEDDRAAAEDLGNYEFAVAVDVDVEDTSIVSVPSPPIGSPKNRSSLPASRNWQLAPAPAPVSQMRIPPVPLPRVSPGPRPLPPPTASLGRSAPGNAGGVGQPRFFRPGDARVHSRAGSESSSAPYLGGSRIPICARCSITIRGPFVVALDRTWCPEHFTCDKCARNMIDMGFIETSEGRIVCEDDYGRYLAPRCHKCSQSIIGTVVTAMETTWHTDCFLCAHCSRPIAGGLFHVEAGKPYCEADYSNLFTTKCVGCQFPIEPGDKCVDAGGNAYHVSCFNCTTCQRSLSSGGFVVRNGRPYCKVHARGV